MDQAVTIEARNLSFAYDREPVLEDVNLQIGDREFISIVGPNGGGKTTLLKLILGLLSPTQGTITIFGSPPARARERIGYMPQYAQLDLQFPVNVLDVVLLGRLSKQHLWGRYSRSDRAIAFESLREVGLENLSRRPFSALSGGQRQRVLIARALACKPDLLLLDEPTANLDLRVQDDFYELLKKLSERQTVILVSHDVGYVSKLVRRVICVNRGVSVHESSELEGREIVDLYGQHMHMIHHHHHG